MRLPNKYLKQFYPIKLWAEDTLYKAKVYKFRDTYFCYNQLGVNMSPEGIKVGDIYSSDRWSGSIEITSIKNYREGGYTRVNVCSRSTQFNQITSELGIHYFLCNHNLYPRLINLPWSLNTNIKKHKLV